MKKIISITLSLMLAATVSIPTISMADGTDSLVQEDKRMSLECVYDQAVSGSAIAALYLDNELVKVQTKDVLNASKINFEFENTKWKHYDEAKVIVFDEDTASNPNVKEFSVMPTNNDPFAGDEEINVVFLGDSLYEATNVVENHRFTTQIGKWFVKNFKDENTAVNYFCEGRGGTTSEFALARVVNDVVSHNPDIVFVCLTINDEGRDTGSYIESIVRTLRSLENPPYIIMTNIPRKGKMAADVTGLDVAEFYNIPVIDPSQMLKRVTTFGITEKSMWSDGAHPNALGHDIISDEFMNCLESKRYFQMPSNRTDKLYDDSGTLDITSFDKFSPLDERVTRTGTWSDAGGVLTATEEGSTLEFTFDGNILAFEYGLKIAGGILEVYIDNKLMTDCDSWYWGTDTHQLVCKDNSAIFNLSDGTHNVKMKVVPNYVRDANGKVTEEKNSTVNYRLSNIYTGSWAK